MSPTPPAGHDHPEPGRRPRPGASSCNTWRGRVSDFVDHHLTASERRAMQTHLDGCEACRREVALEAAVRDGVRGVEAPDTPLALADRLVSIGEADHRVWLSSRGTDVLPSKRDRRRKALAATLGTLTLMLAVVVGVGWTLAPALQPIDDLTDSAADEAGAVMPTPARDQTSDPMLDALARLAPSDGAPVLRPGQVLARPVAISGDTARLLLGAWPADSSVGATVCAARTGCVDVLVRATGSGAAATVFDDNNEPSATVTWAPLAGIPRTARWSFLGPSAIDGDDVLGLQATGADGGVLRRWWVSTLDLRLVQIDSYLDGSLAATQTFRQSAPTASGTCPDHFVCPAQLAGLPLMSVAVDRDSDPQQVKLLYEDADAALAVVEQRGRLVGEAGEATIGGFVARSWQSDSLVFAVTSTRTTLLDSACADLPHLPAASTSNLRRIQLGWERLGGS